MIMIHALSRKQLSLALSCAIALGAVVVPGAATAQINPADTGYLTDRRDTVARSGFGLCWHTGTGPPVSTIECDPIVAPAPLARVEPAPRPVALAAVTPEAAPRVVPERVTLDADALFDFDKAVLRPAGRAALDDFVGKIKGIDPEMIVAVGHTDRFGSAAYNQRLSEQRVAAVKTYLVGKGIEADRIRAEGKGEAQPVTKAGECDGSQSAQVIACLQPDRRVEIEVVGTRLAR
jgi:OmpA-OmpF porin, OOP family